MWVRSALSDAPKTDFSVSTGTPTDLEPEYSTSAIQNGHAPVDTAAASRGSMAYRRASSSASGERKASLVSLEMGQLSGAIEALEVNIMGIERDTEEVQEAISRGIAYRGKDGNALIGVEACLMQKEQQLRDKERQLREEKIALLRSNVKHPMRPQAFEEKRRLSQVDELIKERRLSTIGHQMGDEAGTDTVANVFKLEEDSRLLVKLGCFDLPILVSTLLSGFSLVLFDVANTESAQQVAILSFALEISASAVLSLIAFRGRQLYAHATAIIPLTRIFLRRMCVVIWFALALCAGGVVTFVIAVVLEAGKELGAQRMKLAALVFCPIIISGLLFVVSNMRDGNQSKRAARGE